MPIQCEVAQPHIQKVFEPVADFVQDKEARLVPGRDLHPIEKTACLINTHCVDICDILPLQSIEQGLLLKPGAVTIRTYAVASVTGEEDPDRHLVGFCLQPIEEPANTIVVRCPVNDVSFLGFGETPERDIGRNLPAPAEIHQIFKLHPSLFQGAPGLHGPLFNGQGRVRDDKVQVDINNSPEPSAGLTRPHRRVEGKEVGSGLGIGYFTTGTPQGTAEGKMPGRLDPEVESAAAKPEGLFQGVYDAFFFRGFKGEPVRHDLNLVFMVCRLPAVQIRYLSLAVVPGETRAMELFANLLGRGLVQGNGEGDDHLRAPGQIPHRIPHMGRGFGKNRFAAAPAVEFSQPGEEQFQVIREFRHGAHGRARGPYRILSVDGNGGGDVLNPIHQGTVHTLHELSGIGGKCLDIAALALGVQGIEGEGRFARTAHAGHHGNPVERNVQGQVF